MGGGSSKGGKITADNLYSQDLVEFGLAVGEGTNYGLEKGLNSFYVGGIPFKSETGDLNFQDVCVSFRHGYIDDAPITYVMGGEGSVMKESVGITLPGGIVRTIITPPSHRGKIERIDIRLLVSALFAGDSKGNRNTSSVIFSIKYRKVVSEKWQYVTETLNSIYSDKGNLDTLRQEAKKRGLDFNTMSSEDQQTFAMEVLTDNSIISSSDQLVKKYIPTPINGGYGLGGLTGLSATNVAVYKWSTSIKEQIGNNESIVNAYNEGSLTIEGKTSGGYIREICIPIFDKDTDTHDWEIQITRLSKDLTSDEKLYSSKEISLESITLITDSTMSHPKTSLCHVVAQHTDRFDNIPDFSADMYGFMCDVPTNYNPFEHTYDETTPWDGSYKKAWTNNPWWLIREVIMNQDWGLRKMEPRIAVNNANIYALAKYCDVKVPNYRGVLAPRYTYNEVVRDKVKIKDYLNTMAGTVHGTLREINGVYYGFMDVPNTPKFFVNPEIILQPNFQYSSADLESKYNQVRVSFMNKENNYEQDRRQVVDNKSIDKYGIIPYDFTAVGCTDVSEAIRQAVYAILTNRDEDIFTTFQIPRLGHLVNLYDHFYLAHKENGWGNHARIDYFNLADKTIHLRDSLFESSYTVMFHTPYGIEKVSVQSLNPYVLQITSQSDELEYLIEDCPIIISGGIYGEPKIFRVLSMTQDDTTGLSGGEVFEFKAAIVSEDKFTAIDNINDPNLVQLSFDATDKTYTRDPLPTMVENVQLRYKNWSTSNGNLIYMLSFNAEVAAHYYDVIWVDENTGEERNQRIFSNVSELSPAFNKDTSKVTLHITPYDRKGNKGQVKYVKNMMPYTDVDAQMPILQSIAPSNGNIVVKWSSETSDMFDYAFKYFSYSTPKETVTNNVLTKDTTSYSVPDHGIGDYSFQLTYDRDGSGVKAATEVWSYNSKTQSTYNQPQLKQISSSKTGDNGTAATTGNVFVQLTVEVPEWVSNTDLASLNNPFSVRQEVEASSGVFEFITGKYYIVKLSNTTAKIVLTDQVPVGVKLQVRIQNQWGTTYSAWSEIKVPSA